MIDKIASKTFASQFISPNTSQMISPFQRLILAIKNDRCDLLSSIASSKQQLMQKDEGEKNLLSYAAYEKSPLCLLYLLRAGLSYTDTDQEHKNIYHFLTYSGSIDCLQTLNFYIKLTKLKKLNEDMMKILGLHGYKRTDMKGGKLKYTVSPKRQAQFEELQKQATALYKKYLDEYIGELYISLKQKDQKNLRNPIHLGCLNKYQKCLPTLEQLIYEILQPNIVISYKILNNFQTTNAYFEQKIDPRLYEATFDCLSQILLSETKDQILKAYEKQAKYKICELLQMKDKDQQSALYIASKNGSTAMINFLQKYVPDPKLEEKQEIMKVANNNLARSHILDLCQASKLADVKPLNFLISCGQQVNEKKTIFGTFPLLQALKSFQKQHTLEPLKALIKSGANVNAQDTNGWTILHHAANLGLKEVIEELLNTAQETRLDVNKVTNKRYHSLHIAAMEEHPQIIKLLIQHPKAKVNINIADWNGCTALLHAAKKGSINSLRMLLSLKANIYAKDVRDMTALHHAAFTFHPQCIKQLLNYDSDFDKLRDMRNSKGKLAKDLCTDSKPFENIFTAARTGNVNLIRKLTADNPNLRDSVTLLKQRTPLILAVLAKSLVSVKFLVDNGADTYHQDKQGKSAAVYCDELLTEAKKNKNQSDIKTLQQIKRLLE